jgi:glutamine synthetase
VIVWGHDKRTCGFRLIGDSAASLRVENRIPGGDANPYLTFAATLAAGLYGIERHRPRDTLADGHAISWCALAGPSSYE